MVSYGAGPMLRGTQHMRLPNGSVPGALWTSAPSAPRPSPIVRRQSIIPQCASAAPLNPPQTPNTPKPPPKSKAKVLVPPTLIPPPALPEKGSDPWLNGVLLIDKPLTWTSHDVCNKLKYSLDAKKIGHAGTLDPLATGLLIVCVGKGTKSVELFMAETKEYSGVMRLGESTPSYDAETDVDGHAAWEHLTDEQLQAAASEQFTGNIQQVPPIFSALKVGGRKMYDAARSGEQIRRDPRPVTVEEFRVRRDEHNPQDVHYWIRCSKGTYVRSLIHDLGKQVGSLAYVRELRRETSGEFSVADAWKLDDLVAEAAAKGLGRSPKERRQQQRRNKRARTSGAAAAEATASGDAVAAPTPAPASPPAPADGALSEAQAGSGAHAGATPSAPQ